MTHHARQKATSPAQWFVRGTALARQGDDAGAAEALAAAIRAQPGHVEALALLSRVLGRMGHADAAAAAAAAALRLRSGHAEAAAGFCAALVRLAQAAVPVEPYLGALPDSAPLLVQAGVALGQAALLEPALAAFDLAASRHPADVPALVNRGCALFKLGRFGLARDVLRDALARAPADVAARFGLANALLALGEWAEGWAAYEARWQLCGATPPPMTVPLWRGEPLAGRRILVHAEQGLGDTLHFARFLPLVVARGGVVVLQVPAPLQRLAAGFPGVAEVVTIAAPSDVHCPLLSLPGILGGTPATVAPPYLQADPALVARWAARLPADGRLRVGLAWAGGPPRENGASQQPDAARSMRLAQMTPLLAVPGIQVISLQKGAQATGLCDPMGEVADFADTAAIVAALDLVISVDTSVAHLAGAMGKPVWMMCRWDPCWRWPRGGSTSPWYPTMRIFRQPRLGDWTAVVTDVAAALSQR